MFLQNQVVIHLAVFLLLFNHTLKYFVPTLIGSWGRVCNFHGDTCSASPRAHPHLLRPCSFSIASSSLCSPALILLFCLSFLPPPPFNLPLVFFSFLSQSITLSFLPWRQYYQRGARSKLHPESFLGLQIGVGQGWNYIYGTGRACCTHQLVPVSCDSHCPPPVLRRAVVPVLSPLQHTPASNRSLLEGCCEQNDQLCRTGPSYAKGSL